MKTDSRLIRDVFARDGWKCRICQSREHLNAHHIVFRSQMGLNGMNNLVTICFYCHDAIHRRQLYIRSTDASQPLELEFQGYVPR